MTSNRSLAFIGAGVLAVVVVSLIAVLLLGRGQASYAPGSPQTAFQEYITAFEEGDYEAAYALFSDQIKESMSEDEFRREASFYEQGGFGAGAASRRILFRGTSGGDPDSTADGERVRLELTVEEFYGGGGPFGGSGSFRWPLDVNMVREGGEWRIDDPLVGLQPGPAMPHPEP